MNFILEDYVEKHSPGYVINTYYKGIEGQIIYGNRAIIPETQKCDEHTLYDIASLTKTYTATLLYIAYEEKKIELYANVKEIDDRFTKLDSVRIIDLLCHNQEIWTDGYLGNVTNKDEFYRILFSATVKSTIPTYVDIHYIILSTILEKIYQKSYAAILQEKILDKLELKATTVYPKGDNIASNNYEKNGDQVTDFILPGMIHDTKGRTAKKLGIITGHASIFTTGHDLFLFLKSFLDASLLTLETIDLMKKHYDIEQRNYETLKKIVGDNEINKMYEDALMIDKNLKLSKTYNFMGARYRNSIQDLNDVPLNCSDDTIVFSGYTGPMYVVDFQKQLIIVIMCNVIHNTILNRIERKKITEALMNSIVEQVVC